LALGFDEKFILIWEYYLIYSAAGCKSGAVRDYQVGMLVCIIHKDDLYMLFPEKWKSFTPSGLRKITFWKSAWSPAQI
jgi:hypothetical protein